MAFMPSVVEWVSAIADGSVMSTAATDARASASRWRASGQSSTWARPVVSSQFANSAIAAAVSAGMRPDRPGVQVDPGAQRRQGLPDGGQPLLVR